MIRMKVACSKIAIFGLFLLLVFPALPQYSAHGTSPSAFTVSYDSRPHVYLFPLENEMDRNVTVENTGGTNATLQFNATIYGPNGFVKDSDMLGIAPLPQPNLLYLQSADSNKIYIIVDWRGDLDTSYWQNGANYTYTIELSIYPVATPSLKQTVNLTNIVHVLTVNPPSSASGFGVVPNASVSGHVLAAGTDQPVSGADVTVATATFQFRSRTDSTGNYNVPLIAYRRVEQGNYIDYNLQVSAPGYQSFSRVIAPANGQNVVLNAEMVKANQTASYTVFAQFDTHMNNDRGAGSADGRIFAVVPFHTLNVNSDYIYQNSYIWTFGSNGTLLWKYRLYSETPAVDVSADGSMIVTSVTTQHPRGGVGAVQPPISPGIYLFDAKGNVMWTYTSNQYLAIDSVMELRFSHSGRYLAAGDGQGNAVMFDIATRNVLWHSFLSGQIRDILFNQNDSAAYFSSGDGYLYAFSSVAGARMWRAYAGAWGLSMTISDDYLMVSGKNGYYLYLFDKGGHTLWTAPVYHAGFHLIISPDQSFMVYYGSAAGTTTTIFRGNGTRELTLEGSNGGALSSDGKYLTETGTVSTGQTYVSLFTRSGNLLWTTLLSSTEQHPTGEGYSWISPDKTEIIATTTEYVYFLHGSVTNITTTTTTTTTKTSTSTTTTTAIPEFSNVGFALLLSVVVVAFALLFTRTRGKEGRMASR